MSSVQTDDASLTKTVEQLRRSVLSLPRSVRVELLQVDEPFTVDDFDETSETHLHKYQYQDYIEMDRRIHGSPSEWRMSDDFRVALRESLDGVMPCCGDPVRFITIDDGRYQCKGCGEVLDRDEVEPAISNGGDRR